MVSFTMDKPRPSIFTQARRSASDRGPSASGDSIAIAHACWARPAAPVSREVERNENPGSGGCESLGAAKASDGSNAPNRKAAGGTRW